MEPINNIVSKRNNVNVVKELSNNVYDDNIASKIQEALDKPKAIGEILAEKLDAPDNLKLYIKLAYQFPQTILFECLSLTDEASREGRIRTTRAQYFYGIVKRRRLA